MRHPRGGDAGRYLFFLVRFLHLLALIGLSAGKLRLSASRHAAFVPVAGSGVFVILASSVILTSLANSMISTPTRLPCGCHVAAPYHHGMTSGREAVRRALEQFIARGSAPDREQEQFIARESPPDREQEQFVPRGSAPDREQEQFVARENAPARLPEQFVAWGSGPPRL
ncbi:MAG: hypothetical protein Tsb0020_28600 [Haliangiales bacterium]